MRYVLAAVILASAFLMSDRAEGAFTGLALYCWALVLIEAALRLALRTPAASEPSRNSFHPR